MCLKQRVESVMEALHYLWDKNSGDGGFRLKDNCCKGRRLCCLKASLCVAQRVFSSVPLERGNTRGW